MRGFQLGGTMRKRFFTGDRYSLRNRKPLRIATKFGGASEEIGTRSFHSDVLIKQKRRLS